MGGEAQPQLVALPPALEGDVRTIITTDDNGFVWAGARGTRHLFRLNPRGPGYTQRRAPELFMAQQRYDPTISAHSFWQRYEPPVDLTLDALVPSTTGFCAIGTFSNGGRYELSIAAGGASLATPVQPAPSGLQWRAIGARLECGNHDVTAAEVGGRVFISGGAMHYRGFPASHWEFDEIWSLGPDDLERPLGWRTETHFPPAPPQQVTPREYNGLCAVGSDLWIVGGSVSASQPAASRPDDRVRVPRFTLPLISPPTAEKSLSLSDAAFSLSLSISLSRLCDAGPHDELHGVRHSGEEVAGAPAVGASTRRLRC